MGIGVRGCERSKLDEQVVCFGGSDLLVVIRVKIKNVGLGFLRRLGRNFFGIKSVSKGGCPLGICEEKGFGKRMEEPEEHSEIK